MDDGFMTVEVKVRLRVHWAEDDLRKPKISDPLYNRIVDSVQEAVTNAVQDHEIEGFDHELEDVLSLELIGTVAAEV